MKCKSDTALLNLCDIYVLKIEITLPSESDNEQEKLLCYNKANRAVAILCNHQRALPKTFEQSMANLQAKVRRLTWFIGRPSHFQRNLKVFDISTISTCASSRLMIRRNIWPS